MYTHKTLMEMVPKSSPRYDNFIDVFPSLKLLSCTPQDKFYHGEGDVWTHTKMVCDVLLESEIYQKATPDQKFVLWYSCLLHDIAKPPCTKIEDGHISSAGHSKRGAIDARILLWKMGVPFELREEIANIIAVHQVPFNIWKKERPEFSIKKLSYQLKIRNLLEVARADIQGRICSDMSKVLDDIRLMEEMAIDLNCLTSTYDFPDEATRFQYFHSDGAISCEYPYFKKFGSEVTILCGLPASGKDTWVKKNAKGLTVLSFDDEKKRLKLKESDNTGRAVHNVIDQAKVLLRNNQPFVWNATHLSKQMRNKTIDLCNDYDARIKIVYLESPEDVIKTRNSKRDSTLTNKKLDEMLFKWEVPHEFEAHEVAYEINI